MFIRYFIIIIPDLCRLHWNLLFTDYCFFSYSSFFFLLLFFMFSTPQEVPNVTKTRIYQIIILLIVCFLTFWFCRRRRRRCCRFYRKHDDIEMIQSQINVFIRRKETHRHISDLVVVVVLCDDLNCLLRKKCWQRKQQQNNECKHIYYFTW